MSSSGVATTSTPSLHDIPIKTLRGVGPRIAARLEKLGVYAVADLLFHLPLRYEDRTRQVALGSLQAGQRVVVNGVVELTETRRGRRSQMLCRISDGSGFLTLRFFNYTASMRNQLERGTEVCCFGEVRGVGGALEMIHPEFVSKDAPTQDPEDEVGHRLTAIYPVTDGLHQLTMRKLMTQAIALLEADHDGIGLIDWIPTSVAVDLDLPALREALLYLHAPPKDVDQSALESGEHAAVQRLAFEELLAHHLSLRLLRERWQEVQGHAMKPAGELHKQFMNRLAFSLTAAQQRVVAEITKDLTLSTPMLRLVQGDVGSGKTVVAALAALAAVESGFQVAIMAPTELLAEQHQRSFSAWLVPLGIQMQFLTGSIKGAERRAVLASLSNGSTAVAVGTHALFQDEVEFSDLGLVIIDEQHRFGVHQRLALREKGAVGIAKPHQLIMTATPIPRTLAMTAYADLDVSVIDELPPGRIPVTTVVLSDDRRDEVIERVSQKCTAGRQVYWVCTLIEESETLQCQAAEDAAAELGVLLPNLRIGLVHGRMKALDKEQVMARFKSREIDLLVATTVIEVGVDVPNASLMIIENAERLGLAQLHQLRGRVGRGLEQSHCVLLYHPPLGHLSRKRLAIMRKSNDGFVIAQHDLEIRGPGEVLGTRQAGLQQLRVADLIRDAGLVLQVQKVAIKLVADYPSHVQPLIDRWLVRASDYTDV